MRCSELIIASTETHFETSERHGNNDDGGSHILTVHLQSADGCHDHGAAGLQSRRPALDVEEFLHPNVLAQKKKEMREREGANACERVCSANSRALVLFLVVVAPLLCVVCLLLLRTCTKSGLGDDKAVRTHRLKGDPIGNDGRIADGNVGKGTGVDQDRSSGSQKKK